MGLKADGVTDISIKFLGGLRVLVIFKNETDANNFLANGKPIWSNWFTYLDIWNGQDIEYQRAAWLKIDETPFNAWDSQCFESIGVLFGRVISPAASPLETMDLSAGCMCVLVKSLERIEEMVDVMWRENRYKIFVC